MNGAPKQAENVACRLGDADLGPGELGGVAADEVVGGLGVGQPADRRQDPERIGRQEDDVRGWTVMPVASALPMNRSG